MPSGRTLFVSLVAGVVHAVVLLAVARHLGYAVGPANYSPVGSLNEQPNCPVDSRSPVFEPAYRRTRTSAPTESSPSTAPAASVGNATE